MILGIMVLLIGAELSALWFTIHTLSAVRAYVGAEGLWSKAEKDAVYQLEVYGRTRDARDFRVYLGFLSVPLGDRQARLEMGKPDPDRKREIQGFMQGRNDPTDIPGMIALFQRFNRAGYLSDAIADWTRGDALTMQVQALGSRLYDEVAAGRSRPTIDQTLFEIESVNSALAVVEDRLSYTWARVRAGSPISS